MSDIELLIKTTQTPFERALIELAFATGCRIAELAGMRVEQIDWESQKIVVLGKGNKERLVFFGLPAKKALRAYLGERATGFLFGPSCMAWRRERVQVIRKIEFTKLEWCWHWIEGSRFPRYAWLGEVETTSQAEAETALRKFVKENFSLPMWISEAVPNRTTKAVWWRSHWREYDPERGRVHRYCWLGSKVTTSRDEALKRLRQHLAGRCLTPPLRVEQRERVHFREEIEWVVRRVRSHSRIGEPYTARHLSRFFEAIGRRAGIATHCHALRHSAATAMFQHGAPIRELQELLGHSSVSVTANIYLHSSTNDLMEVHRKFHPREENENVKEA